MVILHPSLSVLKLLFYSYLVVQNFCDHQNNNTNSIVHSLQFFLAPTVTALSYLLVTKHDGCFLNSCFTESPYCTDSKESLFLTF